MIQLINQFNQRKEGKKIKRTDTITDNKINFF